LAAIGNELENPFGNDVNDLPLDSYCSDLGKELDILMSVKAPKFADLMKTRHDNQVLWPLSNSGCGEWRQRSEDDIRSALRAKVVVGMRARKASSTVEKPSRTSSAA
jgi:putative membrane protein